MITQLKNALAANPAVTGWLVSETATVSSQAFYVMQKRETTRRVETCEYQVTVYRRHGEGGKYLGSSSFALSRKLTKRELAARIDEAVYAAQFVRNKTYDLVEGGKKRSWKESEETTEPFVFIDGIAAMFFAAATPVSRFNALEIFHTRQTVRIVNSRGLDLTKTLAKTDVEAIPSYDGPERKVELIRQYSYKKVEAETIRRDAAEAIADVALRHDAVAAPAIGRIDVILRGEDVADLFENLVANFSYADIYRETTEKRIGDMIQKDPRGDVLTIGWAPTSRTDAFDRDGVLLAPTRIVEAGKIVGYFGSNQYACYLGMKPAGVFSTLEAKKGRTSYASMAKKPHLEILALSGIQIDVFSGYIGGEVRLAVWFDGKRRQPVSGFSFSGNIDQALSDVVLSRETVDSVRYRGPRYLKLKNMDIL
jgi:PmbA protein